MPQLLFNVIPLTIQLIPVAEWIYIDSTSIFLLKFMFLRNSPSIVSLIFVSFFFNRIHSVGTECLFDEDFRRNRECADAVVSLPVSCLSSPSFLVFRCVMLIPRVWRTQVPAPSDACNSRGKLCLIAASNSPLFSSYAWRLYWLYYVDIFIIYI